MFVPLHAQFAAVKLHFDSVYGSRAQRAREAEGGLWKRTFVGKETSFQPVNVSLRRRALCKSTRRSFLMELAQTSGSAALRRRYRSDGKPGGPAAEAPQALFSSPAESQLRST